MTDDTYLIWSHEHAAWWGPGGSGYTTNPLDAGHYSYVDAIAICVKAIPGTADKLGALPELPIRLADIQAIIGRNQCQYPNIRSPWLTRKGAK